MTDMKAKKRPSSKKDLVKIRIILTRMPEGYMAYAPILSGCITGGDSREHAIRMMRDAISCYLHSGKSESEPLPYRAETEDLYLTWASQDGTPVRLSPLRAPRWKKIKPTKKKKKFCAVEMKRRAQREIMKETAGMTSKERRKYLRKKIEASPLADLWKRLQERQKKNPPKA